MPSRPSPAFPLHTTLSTSEHTAPSELDLLRATINQVDYGLVAVDADTAAVLFANAAGYAALQSDLPGAPPCDSGLRLVHERVVAARPSHAAQLTSVLLRTKSGLRGLLCLGQGAQAVTVAVVPLPGAPVISQIPPSFATAASLAVPPAPRTGHAA